MKTPDMANEPISTLMQRRVQVVEMDQTVSDIEALFSARGLHWAPVIDPQGDVIGVVSAADLVQLRARGPQVGAVPAWQLCTYKPISVDASTPIADVARQMVARHLHHVVVTEQGRVAGVVSSLDFVRAFA
jgi:predicted transcriptional regulator